jgi:Ni/Co efflux regulator RcnB
MITNCYTGCGAAPYHAPMRIIALLLALAMTAGTALAQPAWKRDGRDRQMRQEDRERMREDMRDAYRDRERRERPERGRQMTPEERDKLRRDIDNANRDLRRR